MKTNYSRLSLALATVSTFMVIAPADLFAQRGGGDPPVPPLTGGTGTAPSKRTRPSGGGTVPPAPPVGGGTGTPPVSNG